MIETARHQMRIYYNKVPATDIQSQASLLHMLGYSLMIACDASMLGEGLRLNLGALRLIRAIGKRSTREILMGVWPEDCVQGLTSIISTYSPNELKIEVMLVMNWIYTTREAIETEMERFSDDPGSMKTLETLSKGHLLCQARALGEMAKWCSVVSDDDYKKLFLLFWEHLEELKVVCELGGWESDFLTSVKRGKGG
jgi:hypothetical protein